MASPTPPPLVGRRRAPAHLAVAAAVLASLVCGIAGPAAAAPADAIAPHTDAWGRYFVDSWNTKANGNRTENTTPATNAAIGLLSPMLQYWTPETPATAAFDANGKFIPTSTGTIINQKFHDANIAESVRITTTRTQEQADNAYRFDRRNQNYSAVDGLGPWADAFRTGAQVGTTIPDAIPADATTVQYDDKGNVNNNGKWAEPTSVYGPMVQLIEKVRNTDASTNPSKAFYSYARPFRWSTDVSIVPALQPVKKKDVDALTDGGYPSGHTNAATIASLALAYSAPERFQEILTSASEIGNSRIVAGMHSPADVIGGRMMASAVTAATLNLPENAALKAQAIANGQLLLATPATGTDKFADEAMNEKLYAERLTYGLPSLGTAGLPVVVPKGAEVLIESRLPYLTAEQRRWVLQSTGLESGHALLDDAEGWGRLNLYSAADGYSAFDTDVVVAMDATAGGFSAADSWNNDIEGVGSLTKQGTGELTLTGANSFTGGVTVQNGELEAASATALGAGSLTVVDGVLSESSAAPVRVAGNLTVQKAAELELTIGDDSPALAVKGAASLGGSLTVTVADGFVPADDAVIATFASLGAGTTFDSVRFVGLPAGYTGSIEIRDGAVHLVNTSAVPGTITTGTPAISGSPAAGQTLAVSTGTWGPTPVSFTYQWFRGSELITGATESTYTAGSADVGKLLSVQVTGSKTGYAAETRTAEASGVVVAVLTLSDDSVTAGETITVNGAGFAAGETVRLELRSAPVAIGTAVTAANGTFSARVRIPADTVGGAHSVVALGATSGVTASAALSVTALAPAASSGALASTGASATMMQTLGFTALALLVLGAGLMVVRMRARRA